MRRLALFCLCACTASLSGQETTMPPPREIPTLPPLLLQEGPPPPPMKLWCGGVEAGLSGTEGNSENMKLRLGGQIKRENKAMITKADFLYSQATVNGVRSENRGMTSGRHE